MTLLRRVTIFFLLAFVCGATPALAGVAWELGRTISPPEKALDVAASMDGSRVFVLTAGGQVRIYDQRGELTGTIPVDPGISKISVVGLQNAGIPERLFLSGAESGKVQELALRFALDIDTDGAPFIGPADAPVEIIEFSDFQCSHCARVKPLIEEIMLSYPDHLRVVFKNFPLSFHEHARPAALAAMAAQNQGKFWEFHDELFAAQDSLDPAKIRDIARNLRLDMNRFERDRNSRELAQRLEKDLQDAQRAGVRGTPTLFVNGMLVEQRDAATIRRMVDEALPK